MALEHVAAGQVRFYTPGIAPDPRGIVLGRLCLMTFPTLEGAVSWLRLYSSEASLDELISGLSISKARTPLGSREVVIQVPAVSSYTCDRAARLVRMVGGAIYTGSTKHFVKYRDDKSPYGYDAVDIGAMAAGVELMVHGEGFSQGYRIEGQLPFERLLFRLSIRRLPGSDKLSPEDRAQLLLVISRGLIEGVIRYLWRNKVAATAGVFSPRRSSAFEETSDHSYMIVAARDLPERMLKLFLGTPGIEVFRPIGGTVAVAVGYAHPIELSSCATVFPAGTFHLFWPGDRVDVLPGPLELSDIAHLTKVELAVETAVTDPAGNESRRDSIVFDPIGVGIKLATAMGPPRRVVGTLIAPEHGDRLKRLLFALPPPSLRGQRVAVTDRGIVVLGGENLDIIPLGQLMSELAPGLLVPLGLDIVPRVSAEVLARAIGHHGGLVTVFCSDGPPFQISDSSLVPLERRALAKLEVERAEVLDLSAASIERPSLRNDPVGRFSLWGFPSPADRKALPETK
jgi:FtsH ternary system domain X7